MLTLAIPNRNGSRYLHSTLASLAANRPFVRWWFQDAQSTDTSLSIARDSAGPEDAILSEPDNGQADALNRAFSRMKGDYLGFLNSDDLLAPHAAKSVLEYFEAHPEVDLVYGEVDFIDAGGVLTRHHAGSIDSLSEILDIYRVWWSGHQWVQPEVFFRRSLWERVGPFDQRYQLAFDYDFWVRCFLAGARVARLPSVLAQFRLHPEQKSRAGAQAAREIRDCVARHLMTARVPAALTRRLRAQLDYDDYRLGEGRYSGVRSSFASYLLARPAAFRLGVVWRRLWISVSSRFSQRSTHP